jgi:hypothetical protein
MTMIHVIPLNNPWAKTACRRLKMSIALHQDLYIKRSPKSKFDAIGRFSRGGGGTHVR